MALGTREPPKPPAGSPPFQRNAMTEPPESETRAPALSRLLLVASPFLLLALLFGLDRCSGSGG
jgi:hypothetical protein